eukprot:4154768-Alexandrium_andersonii.AAC.1
MAQWTCVHGSVRVGMSRAHDRCGPAWTFPVVARVLALMVAGGVVTFESDGLALAARAALSVSQGRLGHCASARRHAHPLRLVARRFRGGATRLRFDRAVPEEGRPSVPLRGPASR